MACYARDKNGLESVWKASNLPIKERLITFAEELKAKYPDLEERKRVYTEWFRTNRAYMWPFDRYKYIDDGGIYTGSQSVHNPGKEGYRYNVLHPKTGKPCREPLMGYRFPEDTMRKLLADGKILFGEDDTKIIEIKLYVQDYKVKLASVIEMDTRLGANELRSIFPEEKRIFGFSKPSEFVTELLSYTAGPGSIILDSFAGSGTTGHAVLNLNSMDNGNRRFILVEMESAIATSITAKRLERVINGHEKIKGIGGGFRFCELGATLFDADGQIRPEVAYDDLAQHIFFIETGSPLPRSEQPRYPLLGVNNGTAVYLLYNGVLKDKSSQGGNVLTLPLLANLPEHFGPKIIYGNGCRIGEHRLRELGIVFKQIPYEIRER